MKQRTVRVLALSVAVISPVVAQQHVYPAKGQSAQQQRQQAATQRQQAALGKARAAPLEGKGHTVKQRPRAGPP